MLPVSGRGLMDKPVRIVRLTIDNDELMSAIHSRGHKALAEVMTAQGPKWIGATEHSGTFDWPVAETIIAACRVAEVDVQIEDVAEHEVIEWQTFPEMTPEELAVERAQWDADDTLARLRETDKSACQPWERAVYADLEGRLERQTTKIIVTPPELVGIEELLPTGEGPRQKFQRKRRWRQGSPRDELVVVLNAIRGHLSNVTDGTIRDPNKIEEKVSGFLDDVESLGALLPAEWPEGGR